MPTSRTLRLLAATVVLAAAPAAARAQDDTQTRQVSVPVAGNLFVRASSEITRVSVGSADIADVAAFPPDQILVTGRRAGVTNATVWTRRGVEVLSIQVVFPADAVTAALRRAVPGAQKLEVSSAGNALVISGEVPSVEDATRAETVARGILAGVTGSGDVPVVNMLTVPGNQQIQLEVSFAEVSRSSLRQIGFNFWNRDFKANGRGYAGGMLSPGTSLTGLSPQLGDKRDVGNLGLGADTFDGTTGKPLTEAVPLVGNPITSAFGFIFSSTLGGFPFSAALSLLSSHGYARTLAEPTLVALNGKTASFLAGGEFPIPFPTSLGQTAIEFKKFGIQLSFTPTVIGDDIQLALAMTVSDVDPSIGVKSDTVQVPGLTERHSESVVRLRDGQSFVIAGLLSDRVRSTVDKVPWLGELPILGTLFRSSSYRRDETELLVVVTAHRVAPLDQRPELPGEHTITDPGDLELFLLGKGESLDDGDDSTQRRRSRKKREPRGAVGFQR